MKTQGRPDLSLVSVIREDDPRNTLMAILQGIQPHPDQHGPYMPSFTDSFRDQQIADIAAYLRSRYSTRPAWPQLADAVAAARKEGMEQ